jgi:MtN3 and saliva related transmembrane protein
MAPIDLLGLLAGALTTLAFVPQVRKAWKSGQTRDISLAMFTAFTLGVALWLVYGLWLGSWPLILSNIVTLGLAGSILALKIRNRD